MGGFSSKEIPCGYGVLSELTSDYPGIEIFDLSLHRRTVRAIEPLGDGLEIGDSLGDLAESSILRSKEQFWKNKEILNLVRMYLDNSSKTLEFFTSFQERLDRARNSHSILQSAINVFKKENRASHKKTLDILNDFMAAKDPFSDEFFEQFENIYKQQIDMLNKLAEEKSRLDAKLKSVKKWKKVFYLLLIATVVAVVILTVIAAVVACPMLVGLAAAAAVPLGLIDNWMSSAWSKKEKKVSGESGIFGTTRDYTHKASLEMENIRAILNKIVINLESLSKMAEFRVKNQKEGLKTAIDDMKKISKELLTSIDKLEKGVVRSTSYISSARKMISKKVEKYQNSNLGEAKR